MLILERIFPQWIIIFAMGSSIAFLRPFFTTNNRWLFVAILFFPILVKKSFFKAVNPHLAITIFIYASWCFCTTFWSEVSVLTFIKSSLFFIVAVTLIQTGRIFANLNNWKKALNIFAIPIALFFLAAIAGKRWNPELNISFSESLSLYRGSMLGANLFGFAMAISLPYILWKLYGSRKARLKFFYIGLIILDLYYLFLSSSRASILLASIIIIFFWLGLKINKRILFLLMASTLIFITIILFPEKMATLAVKYVYKNNNNLFYSRQTEWKTSFNAAKSGGLLGLGYGVSYGKKDFNFIYGLTSSHYGREKGNSQLAVIEETGLIGFSLYLMLLLVTGSRLQILIKSAPSQEHKMLALILTGTCLAMIIHSAFESWWNSPGSPECFIYWLLIGISEGLKPHYKIKALSAESLQNLNSENLCA